jgi:hypothetical protein
MPNEPVWTTQESVDVDVPVSSAWTFMTNVSNWSDPPAEFSLEGPFASGAHGMTRMPGQPPTSWIIRDVIHQRAYTIEVAVASDASVRFRWRFDRVSEQRTTLTQRVELWGDDAATLVNTIRAAFEPNLASGMQRVAKMMTEHAAQDR